MVNRQPETNDSDTKSSDQNQLGFYGIAAGTGVPSTRFQPRKLRTVSRFSQNGRDKSGSASETGRHAHPVQPREAGLPTRGGSVCLHRLAVWISGLPLVDHAAARSGYPRDADIAAERISILTPIGAGLIGLRTGLRSGGRIAMVMTECCAS